LEYFGDKEGFVFPFEKIEVWQLSVNLVLMKMTQKEGKNI
jgi:hypothetical protein